MNIKKDLALWIPAESKSHFFSNAEKLELLKTKIIDLGFTDIFLQVYRQGRTFFKSNFFDSNCESSTLSELISFFKTHNIRLHAWVNVCNLGLNPAQKVISFLGQQAAQIRSNYTLDTLQLNQHFSIDTEGLWLEPSNPKLKDLLAILLAELKQFEFDGLHLDFIRYPYSIPIRPASWINCSADYGYSQTALDSFLAGREYAAFFEADNQQVIRLKSEQASLEFDNWRRDQITNLLSLCRQSINSNQVLSVAALAWSDRAYLNAYQDWRSWLSQNLVQALALMTYTADQKLLAQQAIQAKAFKQQQQTLFAGLGLYKLQTSQQLLEQIKIISDLDCTPCLFCAEALLSLPFSQIESIF